MGDVELEIIATTEDPNLESSVWNTTSSSSESHSIEVCPIHNDGPQENCFICMDDFDEERETTSLRRSCNCNCWMRVHAECLNQWLHQRLECPICHHPHPLAEDIVQHYPGPAIHNAVRRRRHRSILIASILCILINFIVTVAFITCALMFQDNIMDFVRAYFIFLFVFNFGYYGIIIFLVNR